MEEKERERREAEERDRQLKELEEKEKQKKDWEEKERREKEVEEKEQLKKDLLDRKQQKKEFEETKTEVKEEEVHKEKQDSEKEKQNLDRSVQVAVESPAPMTNNQQVSRQRSSLNLLNEQLLGLESNLFSTKEKRISFDDGKMRLMELRLQEQRRQAEARKQKAKEEEEKKRKLSEQMQDPAQAEDKSPAGPFNRIVKASEERRRSRQGRMPF